MSQKQEKALFVGLVVNSKLPLLCLECAAYYKNNAVEINDINDPIERLAKFRGLYCHGQIDLSACDLGPYKD